MEIQRRLPSVDELPIGVESFMAIGQETHLEGIVAPHCIRDVAICTQWKGVTRFHQRLEAS